MARILFLIFLLLQFSIAEVFAHSSARTVAITSQGFSPHEITIDQNSTITFVNRDTVDHWPASDIHPTHDLYPEFDPTEAVSPGSSWDFVPKKVGVWKYHDHLNPHVKGVLIVEKEKSDVQTEASFLENLKERFAAFFKNIPFFVSKKNSLREISKKRQFELLKRISDEKGLKQVWRYVIDVFSNEEGERGNVHDLAHFVGGLIYEKKGFEGLGICTQDFAFGCYHGFLDRAFQNNLDTIDKAVEACKKVGKENSGPFASCVHGIGHGVASFYQTSDLNKSLLACGRLKAGQSFCYDGVFMEFVRNASLDFYKVSNPLYPCNSLEQTYVFSCGRNVPAVFFGRFHLSFENAVKQCEASHNQDLKLSCFDALGFTVTSWSKGSARYIIDSCNAVEDSTFRWHCLTAGAGELVFQDIKGWKESALKVCAALSGVEKKTCDDHVRQIIRDYGR